MASVVVDNTIIGDRDGRVAFFRSSDGLVWDTVAEAFETAPSSGAWAAANLITPSQTEGVKRFVYAVPAAVQVVQWDALVYFSTIPDSGDTPDEILARPQFRITAERCTAAYTYNYPSPGNLLSPKVISENNGFAGDVCFDYTNLTGGVSLSSATLSIATGTGTKPVLSNVRLTDDKQKIMVHIATVDGTTGEETWRIICEATRVDSVVDPRLADFVVEAVA